MRNKTKHISISNALYSTAEPLERCPRNDQCIVFLRCQRFGWCGSCLVLPNIASLDNFCPQISTMANSQVNRTISFSSTFSSRNWPNVDSRVVVSMDSWLTVKQGILNSQANSSEAILVLQDVL
jgi:hypothetical protein